MLRLLGDNWRSPNGPAARFVEGAMASAGIRLAGQAAFGLA
jgi:hypothetical protein